jgi:hypothetical protein
MAQEPGRSVWEKGERGRLFKNDVRHPNDTGHFSPLGCLANQRCFGRGRTKPLLPLQTMRQVMQGRRRRTTCCTVTKRTSDLSIKELVGLVLESSMLVQCSTHSGKSSSVGG